MQLTKQQIIKANKLLDLLCKSEQLVRDDVYSLFDSERDAECVCSILEERQFLNLIKAGGQIYVLKINKHTCNAVKTNILGRELTQQEKIESKEQLDIEVLKLQKDNLEYQNTIREQLDRIRDLEEQTKFIELLKGYWWILVICVGIGTYMGTLLN